MPSSLTDAARRSAVIVPERKRYSRIPEVLPIPDSDRAPARFVPLVHRARAAGAVRRDQPHPGLHRQGDGAPFQGLRVRRAQVLRARVPHPGPDLLPAALRGRGAAHQGDRRDPGAAGLHGRLPDHDGPGHVHHQRRRAGGGQPARPLARCLLHLGRGPGHRPPAVQRQGHPQPGRVARVRDRGRVTCCTSRSTASASSRPPSCCARWATRPTTR